MANTFGVDRRAEIKLPGLKQPWAGIGERRWRNNRAKKNKKLIVCFTDSVLIDLTPIGVIDEIFGLYKCMGFD